MKIARIFLGASLCLSCLGTLGISAHAQTGIAAPPPPAAAPPPPPTPVAFDAALLKAANDLFSKANLKDERVTLVIDPLIDGVTGAQSNATRYEEKRIVELIRNNYPRFQVAPFSST